MLCPVLADSLFEDVRDDEILAHRFACCAALCDDVEHRLCRVNDIKKCKHTLWVYVVFNVELDAALLWIELVVMEMAECIERRHRAERASADAEHYEVVKVCANFRRRKNDISHDVLLIVWEFSPAHPALATIGFEILISVFCLCTHCFDLALGYTFVAKLFLHHIVEIELNLHFLCLR